MAKEVNYKKLFAIQKKLESTLKIACPQINDKSGIYFLTRVDEEGKHCYIGKAKNLIRRMVSHLQGYTQPIDISLKKRGFYSKDNECGWHLNVMFFLECDLDKQESHYIEMYRNAGYHLYNIESGGTKGKTDINERKPSRGYRDGLSQGYENARRDVSKLFEKNLTYSINGKVTVNKQKAFEKFGSFLKSNSENENS